MATSIREEIKQERPFDSLEEEAAVSLLRTAATIGDEHVALFRSFGVSSAQYNVLRILRGAGAGGLGRNDIRDRLLSRMPDVTRLLDRMEDAGLVQRSRGTEDRRCVNTTLTSRGLALVDRIDGPLAELHRRTLGQLPPERLERLIDDLAAVRGR